MNKLMKYRFFLDADDGGGNGGNEAVETQELETQTDGNPIEPSGEEPSNNEDPMSDLRDAMNDVDLKDDEEAQEPSKDKEQVDEEPEKKGLDPDEEQQEEEPKKKETDSEEEPEKKSKEPEKKEEEQVDEDAEIDGVKRPENLSPSAAENWKSLGKKVREYKQQAEQAIEELKKVRETGLSPEVQQKVETLETELNDAHKRLELIDIENDPEFKTQYDDKITGLNDEVAEILSQYQVKEEVVERIKTHGLSDDVVTATLVQNIYPVLEKHANGSEEESIQANPAFRQTLNVIKAKVDEHDKLTYERGKAVENASGEWQKRREERQQSLQAEFVKDRTFVEEQKQKTAESFNLKYTEVTDDMTPEQKAEANAWNKRLDEMNQRFENSLYPATLESRVQVAIAASAAFEFAPEIDKLMATIDKKNEKIAALEAQVSKARGVSKVKSGSGAKPPAPKKTPDTTGDALKEEDPMKSLRMALDQTINGGE